MTCFVCGNYAIFPKLVSWNYEFSYHGIKQLIRQYEREEVLVDFMRNWTPGSDMEIKYFYYNLVDGELEIHRNEEYDDYFKSLCI